MRYDLLKNDSKYIIAVSGGPDSIFLLDNIYNNNDLNINNFIVCFVNYQKREDSYYDQQIVEQYCQTRKIKLVVKTVTPADYGQYQKLSHNFQALARYLRYDFFLEVARQYDCCAVLIAHNLTDNIETFLLQKQRNGMVEYYGLSVESTYFSKILQDQLTIKRIMLDVSRKFILEYLSNNKINYAIDSTNILAIYHRNIIRQEIQDLNIMDLLAEMQTYNSKNDELKDLTAKYFFENDGTINIKTWQAIKDPNLKQMILFNYFKEAGLAFLIANKKRKFLVELREELESQKPNIIVAINKEYYFVKSYQIVKIIKQTELEIVSTIINDDGTETFWKNYQISKGTEQKYSFKINPNQYPLLITNDVEKLRTVIIKNKKLNRWFIDEKIDLFTRYDYYILDQANNLVYANQKVWQKVKEFINNSDLEKDKKIYFMIK
ncbi:tRNA(Ile)-lysidine synthase [Spiroplasma syrphidicola EA-1]|uniref:tRNA(Ile)-lysidine synthase n=2 Tax=Spiroplasma syrphidicola TaxID=216945 RepID=R4U4X2_9MOLU|nr:tRNA(Ile)-lysidine synthase [Spiroplasma syrphidicola EA-1]